MEFRILGPLEVQHGEKVLTVGGSKRRGLLAYLLVSASVPQSVEGIVEAVWGDAAPRGAAGTVQTYVSQLRKLLAIDPAVHIDTTPGGYLVAMPPDRLDARRLDTLVATAAHTSDPDEQLVQLDEALALWRGTPLAEFDASWADAERARLDALRIRALGMHADVRLELERRMLDGDSSLPAAAATTRASVSNAAALPEGVVTFLLTDIEGSTVLWETAPVAMADALARHERVIRETVRAHLGVPLKMRGEGDATMSVFRNATDAIAAALELQRRLLGEAWPEELLLPTRIVLHSGEAQLRDGDYYGGTLNRAARIRGLAAGGEVLCSRATHDLVADNLPEGASLVRHGEHTLKGLRRPEDVFALVHADLPAIRSAPPRRTSPEQLFIARTREIETLGRAAADVATGRSRVLLISGEAGIGKSALVEYVTRRPEFATLDVLWGRCYEHEGAPPFWSWLQVLRASRSGGSLADRASHLGRDVPVLAQLLPELSEYENAAPPLPNLDGDAARFRLFEAVARLLRNAAAERPLALVLDDVHWADHASLLLLEFAARQLADAPLLLVATYRTPDAHARRSASDAIGELVRLPGTSALTLSGFDVAEVRRFVEEAGHIPVSEHLARALHERTDGNPFFLSETVRLLDSPDGSPDADAIAQMPGTIRAAIARRVNLLPGDARTLLEVAAVIGRDFEEGVLAEAAQTTPGEVAAQLSLAQRSGLTSQVTASRVPRHRFVHALVRDVVYDELGLDHRRVLHARVGESLERVHRDHIEEHVETIARHFVDAIPSYDPARAVESCKAAGTRALDLFAYENAQSLFATAIELLPLVEEREVGLELDLALLEAEALERAGREPAAQRVYLRAVELARRDGDGERLAAAVVGLSQTFYFSTSGGGGAVARDVLFEEALAAISADDSATRARLLATFAEEQVLDRPINARRVIADEALAMARRIGDDATLSFVASCWESAAASPENFEERVALADETLRLAHRLADRRHELWAAVWHLALGLEAAQAGAIAAALSGMKDVDALINSARARWEVLRSECVVLTLEGAFDEAEAAAIAAVEAVDSGNAPGEAETFAAQIGLLRFLQGRFHELLEPLRTMVEGSPLAQIWEAALVAALAEIGHWEEARSRLERLLPEAGSAQNVPSNTNTLFVLASLALASNLLGDQPRARSVYDALRPYDDRIVTIGGIVAVAGPVAYYLGLAAMCLGRHDDAIGHFERAIAVAGRVDGRPFVAMARAGCAETLVARKADGDVGRAAALAEDARRDAVDIGMDRVRERAERVGSIAEQHGRVVAARVRFGAPPDTFVGRHRELATLDELLARPGLVTICGTGGVGKTRLAQEASASASLRFERSWFVPLVGLAGDDAIAPALEAAIAPSPGDVNTINQSATAGPLERVADAIGPRTELLVVDNCEHVRAGVVAAVQPLLARCPNLTVLTTSRERLSIRGERVLALPPLAVDERDVDDTDSEAMRLLRDRAGSAPDLKVQADDAAALVEICKLVDGIPLALELAAARLASTSSHDLLARMSRQLEMLRDGAPRDERHRTVDAAIDWSYQLLEPSEQRLLRRLAVFRGGFTLDAAEQVCRDEFTGELPDDSAAHLALSELVTKSLVVFDRETPRYRLLEPIRLFAQRRLEEAGEAADAANAHVRWVCAVARRLRHAQFGDDVSLMNRALVEFDNVEAAVVWCDATEDDTSMLRIVADVAGCWFTSGWRRGLRLARLATNRQRNAQGKLWAHALLARGRLEQREGFEESVPVLRECLSLNREMGDRATEAMSLFFLGQSVTYTNPDEGRELLELAVAAFRELDQPLGEGWSLVNLSTALIVAGHEREAVGLLEQAVAIARENGLPPAVLGSALSEIANLEMRAGNVDRARPRFREAVATLRTSGDLFSLIPALRGAGWVELLTRNLRAADQFLREAAVAALDIDHSQQLCHALIALAALSFELGDMRQARLLVAATGWDVAPPLGRWSASRTSQALRDLHERLPPGLEDAAEEGRRLGPERAARQYLANH